MAPRGGVGFSAGGGPGPGEALLQQLVAWLLVGCRDMVARGIAAPLGAATISPTAAWVAGRESSTGALAPPVVTLGATIGPAVQLVANGVAADP